MSIAWERTHRRYELTRAVLVAVADTGQPDIPAGLRAEIDEAYGDLDTFMADLRRRRQLVFDARLDALLEEPPPDMARAVADLRRDLDREQPAYRLLLADDRTTPVAHVRTRRVS